MCQLSSNRLFVKDAITGIAVSFHVAVNVTGEGKIGFVQTKVEALEAWIETRAEGKLCRARISEEESKKARLSDTRNPGARPIAVRGVSQGDRGG
jgi:hypothetical protein